MQTIKRVRLNLIRIDPRHRAMQEEPVARLAANIKEVGLNTPITVFYNSQGTAILVAGRNRLEACRRLGHKMIDAFVMTKAEAASKWEIDENLQRTELTALERSAHIAARAKLTEKNMAKPSADKMAQLAPFSKVGAGRGNKGGTRAAAREMGTERTKVQRAERIDKLCDAAKQTAEQLGLANNHHALLNAASQSNDALQVRALRNYRAAQDLKKQRQAEQKKAAEQSAAVVAPVVRPVESIDHERQMARDFWFWALEEIGVKTPTLLAKLRDRDFTKLIQEGDRVMRESDDGEQVSRSLN